MVYTMYTFKSISFFTLSVVVLILFQWSDSVYEITDCAELLQNSQSIIRFCINNGYSSILKNKTVTSFFTYNFYAYSSKLLYLHHTKDNFSLQNFGFSRNRTFLPTRRICTVRLVWMNWNYDTQIRLLVLLKSIELQQSTTNAGRNASKPCFLSNPRRNHIRKIIESVSSGGRSLYNNMNIKWTTVTARSTLP